MRNWRLAGLLLLAGILLAVVAYWPGLEAGFYFDDLPNIVEAPALHLAELSLQGLRDATTSGRMRNRPVANLSFALNHLTGGLEPKSYHVVNLLVHLAVGLVLAWTAWLYGSERAVRPGAESIVPLAAVGATVLYWVHPLNVQAVTYVVQRMSSLATLLGLLAFGLFLCGRRALPRRKAAVLLMLAGASWLLAVGSKENALLVPAVIVAYELCFHHESWRDLCRRLLADSRGRWMLLALLVLAVAGIWALKLHYLGESTFTLTQRYPDRDFSALERLLSQPRVHLLYLSLLLFPAPSRLNLDHEFAVSRSLLDPPATLLATLFWVIVLVGAVVLARKRPRYGFPLLAYLLLHSMESGPLNLELVFEHRMYFPMTMLAFLLTVITVDARPRARVALFALMAILVVPLGAATYRRNVTWSDENGFHYDCARKSPGKFRPQYNLGTVLGRQGRYSEAIPYLERAILLDPESSRAHNQLGNVHLLTQRLDKALAEYRTAVRLDPNNAEAHYNLAILLDRTGRAEEAIPHYRRFLEIAPPVLRAARERAALRIQGLQTTRGQ